MKRLPPVTVVMPSLNQGAFIEAAIRSVLEQDYLPLDLVVADGGSSDDTPRLLKKLAKEFGPRLRWVSEPDSGPAQAVNKALGIAQGKIIGWLNSDDLYASGAVANAVDFLSRNRESLMVYGEGELIDSNATSLGRYPTLPPSTDIDDFKQGCFVCQPTVFLRREIFEHLGFLDERLKTAFDFDFWLRVFANCPENIGFLSRTQAYSRVHSGAITQRMRLEVALEGMEILARHLGEAPAEWLFTYFDETLKEPAFAASSDNLLQVCLETLAKAEAYMSVYEMLRAKEWLASDMRIKLTTPDIFVGVSHDGWASQRTRIRVRFDGKLHSHLRLSCRLAWPRFQPVRLRVSSPWSAESSILVETPERFDIRIPLPTSEESWDSEVILATEDYFVPSQMQPDSQDHRKLAFRVESASLS